MADNENLSEEQGSDQFNSMLNAAQKQVGGGDSGGLGGGGGTLTQAQIEAMLAINSMDEPQPSEETETDDPISDLQTQNRDTFGGSQGGESAEEEPEQGESPSEQSVEEQPVDEDTAIADRFRDSISADSQAAADEVEQKNKQKKEKKLKEKKEKKPIDKVLLARLITVAAVVVAAAFGFCLSLLMFSDFIKSGNEEFSIKAANAVNSKLPINTEMYVYRAYVRNGTASDECMLYAITSFGGVDKTDMYHIVISHDKPNIINVYYTLDTSSPEYISMKESEDAQVRIQASHLKNYSDEIAAADREIQINSPSWEKIDCTIINKNIGSDQNNTR